MPELHDADLERQLRRRAESPGARDWVRGELAARVMSAGDDRSRPERVIGLRPAAALAIVAAIVVLVAVALPQALPPATTPSAGSTDLAVAPPVGTGRQGPYTLTITAGKPVYQTAEPIDVEAILAYDGPAEEVELSGVASLINGFGARQLDGVISIGPGWDEPCIPHSLGRDEPFRSAYVKSGGWDPQGPLAEFYRQFFADLLLRLPAGTWRLTAYSEFFEAPACSEGDLVRLEASVTVTVVGPTGIVPPTTTDPSLPPPSPSASLTPGPVACEESHITFTDHSNTVESCVVIAVDRAPGDGGPVVAIPSGDPLVMELSWGGQDPALCAPRPAITLDFHRRNPEPLTAEPRGYFAVAGSEYAHGTGCRAGVRLNVIRLQLTTPIPAEEVAFAAVGAAQNDREETSVGTFWLGISAQHEGGPSAYRAEEPIDISAEFTYDGPTRSVQFAGGLNPVDFWLEQLDGPIYPVPAVAAVCGSHSLTRGEPVARPFTKMGGFSNDDPLADWYEQYFADPELRLPPGVYLISATAGGSFGGCDGEREGFGLEASILIEVVP